MPPSIRRLHLLLIPLAALLATLPLLLQGTSCGHDLSFHLLSWLEAARAFAHGNLHPRWATSPAFGAGEPRFVFYPPLSWTVGGLLTLLLTHLPHVAHAAAFPFVPTLFTGLALTSAGLAMVPLARRYTSPATATLAATLYLANPYTLFTAYERTAFGELLAATWLPLLLLATLPPPPSSPATTRPTSPNLPLLALTIALLWLTNAPAAVMGCYTVALLATVQILTLLRRRQPILAAVARFTAATLLGLALAAFYILPAAFQQRWVEISLASVPGMRIADNTLFHRTSDDYHNAVVHTVSLIALTLLITTAAALFITYLRNRRRQPQSHLASPAPVLLPLAVTTALIAVLLTPLALPLFRFAPELRFLQFPWRFLAILAPVAALSVALALRSLSARATRPATPTAATPATLVAAALVPAALVLLAWPSFRQGCDLSETPAAQLAAFQSPNGADPTDEYTPATADNDALTPDHPAWTLIPAPPNAHAQPHGPAPTHLSLDLATPETLVLNLRDYPAWQITRNGVPFNDQDNRIDRPDGLLALNLPAGHSHLSITYRTTPDQIAGDAISVVALCVFLLLAAASLRKRASAANPPTPPSFIIDPR